MRIAHVIDSAGLYGAEVMLLNLIREQLELGIVPIVFSLGLPGNYTKQLEDELGRHSFQVIPFRMKSGLNFSSGLKLLREIQQNDIDVIHSHGYKSNILLGLLPNGVRRTPIISTVHGYTSYPIFSKMTLNQFLDKVSLRFLNRVVFVTPATQLCKLGLAGKSVVIFNGISQCGEFFPKHIMPDRLVLGSVGRLCHEKNFEFLIKTMPVILEKYPDAKLIIHGEGPLRAELETLILELDLASHVFLPGYTSDVHKFLTELSVYINCSITEGMPITILEAMRAKTPILASNIPANKFVLGDSNESSLFELNVSTLAKKMEELLSSERSVLIERCEKNFFTFKEKYTSSGMAKNYLEIYRQVTSE